VPASSSEGPTFRADRRHAPDPEACRAAILKAAEAAFTEKGFDGASISRVAGEAGVAKATVFHHFGNKEGLLTALILDRLVSYGQRYHAMAERPLSARQKIEKLARVDKWATAELLGFRRMLVTVRRSLDGEAREGLDTLMREAYTRFHALIADVFREFLGSERPAGLSVETLAATFLACVDGVLVSQELEFAPELNEGVAEALSRIFVDHLESISALEAGGNEEKGR